jgi:hypothetical protein
VRRRRKGAAPKRALEDLPPLPGQAPMTQKKKPGEEVLIPPDLGQCQAEIPNGNTFMTFGGVPGLVRCKNKPTYIAHEPPRKDGKKQGSMSLCGSCLAVCSKQIPGVTFEEIKR